MLNVMTTIAVASQKGGTGKTTTTTNLGAALATQGKRVLLIDMDPQGNLAESFGVPALSLDEEISLVLEQRRPLSSIVNEIRPNILLAPANLQLADLEPWLITSLRREDRLKQALAAFDGGYDVALIDCPPSVAIFTINALSAADQVI